MSELKEWRPDVIVTTGSTFDNVGNLPPTLLARFKDQYEGTSKGRQELYAEILDDVVGALWARADIDRFRLIQSKARIPAFKRIVVAVDPMVTDVAVKEAAKGLDKTDNRKVGGSECGIVVAALGVDRHAYVLADESLSASPLTWAKKAVECYDKWQCDRLVAEKNNGGALVETTIRGIAPTISYRAVDAARGKITRAEPIASFYEQGKVHHVGLFKELEDQMTSYTGDPKEKSPDRMDALVWALYDLMIGKSAVPLVGPDGGTGDNYWAGSNG